MQISSNGKQLVMVARCKLQILVLSMGFLTTIANPVGASMLSGKASWDMNLVKEYIYKRYHITVPNQPKPWRNRKMAAALNGEFAKRLDALMSVYQSMGGSDQLGIVSPDGGLRSKEQQFEQWKKCRRIKRMFGFGPPVGNGSSPDDWEIIPQDERTSEGSQSCGVAWRTREANGDICEHTGPVTMTWNSWHELGLAADLGETVYDSKSKRWYDDVLPTNDQWPKLTELMSDLGMCWGGSSGWDLDHVEFHPQMHLGDNYAGEFGQLGQPIPDDKLRTQYDWKIPDTIYCYDSRTNTLNVINLVKIDDKTIGVSSYRQIKGAQGKHWHGEWVTCRPPMALLPSYIPTMNLARRNCAEDAKFKGETTMTWISYDEDPDKRTFDWRGRRAAFTYAPVVDIANQQSEANYWYTVSSPMNAADRVKIQTLWKYLNNTSVYDVKCSADKLTANALGPQRGRISDETHPGCTVEKSGTVDIVDPFLPSLSISWDRDHGIVGLGNLMAGPLVNGEYKLLSEVQIDNKMTVSDKLPKGAFDVSEPPKEPPAHPWNAKPLKR